MSSPAASIIAALRRNFASIQGIQGPFQGAFQGPSQAASLSQRAFQIGLAARLAHGLVPGPVISCIDELVRGALHEIASVRESEMAAAAGFVLAQAARSAQTILWIAEDISRAESGTLYGPGLEALGLAPERLVVISAARSRDVLWAMEEALRCRAVGAVIGEIRSNGKNRVDLVATRRLSLAAARTGGLAFLLRSEPVAEPSAAVTRWIVGAAPSAPLRHGLSPPRVNVQLVRNRRGPLGSWVLEWNSATKHFDPATANRESLVEAARDRSHRAAASA